MKKILNIFLVIFSAVFSFQVPKLQIFVNLNASSGITEEDFINTMFLKSEFFENWSDTNFFINPTVKTSKPLQYSKTWYLDYLRDSYSTGLVAQRPSDAWMDLYNNYEQVINNYFGDLFYSQDSYDGYYLRNELYTPLSDKSHFLYNFFYLYLNMIGCGMEIVQGKKSVLYPSFSMWAWGDDALTLLAAAESLQQHHSYLSQFPYYRDFTTFHDASFMFDIFARQLWQPKIDVQYVPGGPVTSYATGKLLLNQKKILNAMASFSKYYYPIIIDELHRIFIGGSPDYDFFDLGTEKILFSFQVVSHFDEIIENYQLSLVLNQDGIIRAGNLSFINRNNGDFDIDKLNFDFNFVQNIKGDYVTTIQTFSYDENRSKILYDNITGNLDLNGFLKSFFSNALVPVFENRSKFIESGYLDGLSFDTVIINFFGLKQIDFASLLTDDKGQVVARWSDLMSNIIDISKGFYRDYIRSIFDMDADTYVQGYSHQYGLLCNNGFKIYPHYFYYDDKYQNLDIKLYSSYQNRFYNTAYGNNFNFDYSVSKEFETSSSDDWVFPNDKGLRDKYPFRYVKDTVDSRNIGYNVFSLDAQKGPGEYYRYFDFNFGIYNWQEITKDGLFPDDQWWNVGYDNCSWYDFACHIKNAAIWIVNNIPGIKQGNVFVSGIGAIMQDTYKFFSSIFEMWKFSPALYNTIVNVFVLIFFMKLVRLL